MTPSATVSVPLNRGSLRIAEVADRTGLGTDLLRKWELRHGFPLPRRLSSGHRRYSVSDVERLLEVRRLRESGLVLSAAIRRSEASHDAPSRQAVAAPPQETASVVDPEIVEQVARELAAGLKAEWKLERLADEARNDTVVDRPPFAQHTSLLNRVRAYVATHSAT
jgi:DNA-binding transcriptional MerR regulator